MRNLLAFIAAAVAAMFIFGCIAPVNYSGGMEAPNVCHNLCQPGQTQAPYPDCSCSGGGIGPMPTAGYSPGPMPTAGYSPGPFQTPPGGGGGASPTPAGGGIATPTPAGGGWTGEGPGGAGWGMTADDVLRAGNAAQAGTQEGMIVVFIGSKNANETPFTAISLTSGAVSTYRPGAGGGWSTLSTGMKWFELKGLGGRHALLSQGRAGAGAHTRLLVELRNMSVWYNDSFQNVSMPRNYYVLIDAVPLSYAATSAVRLTLDLNRSISRSPDGSGFVFTPVLEIESFHNARYSVRDDGSVDLSAGTLDLKELALFNSTGAATYSIQGGTIAECMSTCTIGCANVASATCHARCVPQCLGVIDIVPSSCDDGTPYNSCSSHKPLYCVTGTYIMRCSTCGCPQDYDCQSDGTCNYATLPGGRSGQACGGEGCISGNPPMACRSGYAVQDCVACGCPGDKECRASDGVCIPRPVPTQPPTHGES